MAAKYDRVATDLRDRIQAGEFLPGDKLPIEDQLIASYKVSQPTVRAALQLLRLEGLIESRHGLGSYVRTPRHRVVRRNERYQWEKDRVHLPDAERAIDGATEQDTGLTVNDLTFSTAYDDRAKADGRLANLLGVKKGARLLRRTYGTSSRREDVPLSIAHSYMPYELVKANPALLDAANEPWPGGTQHQLSTIGMELDHITDLITARPPTPQEAEQLAMPPGTSLIVLTKMSVATDGRTVEVSDILMPGDRHELVYATNLERWAR